MNFINAKIEHAPEIARYSSLLNEKEVKEEDIRPAIIAERVWIALPEDQVVGYVLVELFDDTNKFVPNSVFISELFVDKGYRKQGIGSGLVRRALEIELTDKHKYFSLTHDPEEKWLTGFYERFGFVSTGVTDVRNVIMVKK